MKTQPMPMPQMYDPGYKPHKSKTRANVFLLIGLSILILGACRFGNLFIRSIFYKLEASSSRLTPYLDYSFEGLSSKESIIERIKGSPPVKPTGKKVFVTVFFTPMYPAVFVIRNNFPRLLTPVDLGNIIVMVKPGISTYTFTLPGMLIKEQDGNLSEMPLERNLIREVFDNKNENTKSNSISYAEKPPETQKYLHIPFLVYFFLPLVLLLLMKHFLSPAVLVGFFYYVGLFILFDFREVFCNIPFQWFIKNLDLKMTDSISAFAAGFIGVLFVLLGVAGILNWKKMENGFKEKLVIIVFVFLPVFLRY